MASQAGGIPERTLINSELKKGKEMRFRPCIDIHNGKVKQIVGGSLQDEGDRASENFVSDLQAEDFARLYAGDGLAGGHVILLNPAGSEHYPATKAQALAALNAAPGTLQAGGGIRPDNAGEFLDAGASHVIVTSYVFREGRIDYDALEAMVKAVGKERLVLDLSCRKTQEGYKIVTDRWQKYTDVLFGEKILEQLSGYCDEFLIHAVDAEGKQAGPDRAVVAVLGNFAARSGMPVTYAGGISSFEDLDILGEEGRQAVDVTIGSALDLFGGPMPYRQVLSYLSR